MGNGAGHGNESEIQAVDPAMIQTMHDHKRAAYGLQPSTGMQQQSSAGTQLQEAADTKTYMHNATIRNLQSTIIVHDRPGQNSTLPEASRMLAASYCQK